MYSFLVNTLSYLRCKCIYVQNMWDGFVWLYVRLWMSVRLGMRIYWMFYVKVNTRFSVSGLIAFANRYYIVSSRLMSFWAGVFLLCFFFFFFFLPWSYCLLVYNFDTLARVDVCKVKHVSVFCQCVYFHKRRCLSVWRWWWNDECVRWCVSFFFFPAFDSREFVFVHLR